MRKWTVRFQPVGTRRQAIRVAVLSAVAVLLLGASCSGLWDRLMHGGFEVRNSAVERADRAAVELGGGTQHLTFLVRGRGAGVDTPEVAGAAIRLTESLRHEPAVVAVHSYWDAHGSVLLRSRDGRSALISMALAGGPSTRSKEATALVERYAKRPPGPLAISVTGPAPADAEGTLLARGDIPRAEALAAPVVFVLLVLGFGSAAAALVPLAVAACSITATVAALNALARVMPVSVFTVNFAAAVGTGLAVDYALFLITRYREQLHRGDTCREACAATMRSAGRAMWLSALTTMSALSVLFVFPLDFLRSMALAGMLVAVLSAASAHLLVPAALVLLGPRLSREDPARRGRHVASPLWRKVARSVTRRPLLAGGICCLVLTAMIAPCLDARFALFDERALPADAVTRATADAIRAGFPLHPERDVQIVLPHTDPDRDARELDAYARSLSRLPHTALVRGPGSVYLGHVRIGIAGVSADTRTTAVREKPSGAVVVVTGTGAPESAAARTLLDEIAEMPAPGGDTPQLAGDAARLRETTEALASRLPSAALLLTLVTMLLLAAGMRSVLVPAKAVVMGALGLAAACGVLVLVFQGNFLPESWDLAPTKTLDPSIPLLTFCIAFALSVDYEVFLIARIREEHLLGADNRTAIVNGMARSGRLISSAACAFIVPMAAIASSGVVLLKQLGVGLAVAVLVDATLLRGVLVPVVMTVAGPANWWFPRRRAPGRRRLRPAV
ncbi:MMPL family transporter [Streptomyces sp. URMC 126]|uniref:MMPL family transporter n=1 Tax=Streptomyces sp. URMC 126 TaxID=3423401 RepID=UPI003F1C8E88